jgi:hypothetical protein
MLSANLSMANNSHVSGTVTLEDSDKRISPLTLRARAGAGAGATFSDHCINVPSGTLEP